MKTILLFIDGSVNTQSKTGYGAYLSITNEDYSMDYLKSKVKIKKFQQTSSTKLELQTLLWAMKSINTLNSIIIIYTDSQNILRLPIKRKYFENNNYLSKNNRLLNNAELYQEFYVLTDQTNYNLIKVKGHQKLKTKSNIDIIFTLVDRASRQAMRNDK